MSRFGRRAIPAAQRTRSRLVVETLEPRAMLSGDGGAGGATPLLPDLIPVADEAQGYMYDWTVRNQGDGRTLLLLTTATANIGAGPLDLRGSTTHPDGTQDVLQRVFQSDGSYVDHLAGDFIYHPEHDHIHFEGYAEYNLRAVTADQGVGDIVATGGKTSFCVIDLDEFDLSLPGAPSAAVYDSCDSTQGLSVGWEDIYHRELPDQWIDVTGVPLDQYWLEVVADPDNHIEELDDTNNVARILIELYEPQPLEPDVFEPNNSPLVATDLGTGSVQIEQLSIDGAADDDWFAWTAAAAGDVTIETHFKHDDGDIDLFLYDAQGHFLDSSEGVENVERVTLHFAAGQRVLIQVVGYEDAVNPDYSLSIDAGGDLILPDSFEPNNSLETAAHLDPGSQSRFGLTIHSATDGDYFRWTAPGAGELRVATVVGSAGGEVELRLFNMLHEEIALSATAGDYEFVSLDRIPAGTLLYLGVIGAHGHTVPSYELQLGFVPRLSGDANGDFVVDLHDLNLVRNHFGQIGEHVSGDTDFDGDVDLEDLNAVRNNFGQTSFAAQAMSAPRMDSPKKPAPKREVLDILSRIPLYPQRPLKRLTQPISEFRHPNSDF